MSTGISSSTDKSTNVRLKAPTALRGLFSGLSKVSPTVAGRLAAPLFSKPHRRPPRGRDASLPPGAATALVRDPRGRRIPTWTWGEGPRVLLLHGWSGRAAQMGDFVTPLVEAGFSVTAADLPGHGDADGFFSSMPDMAGGIAAIARALGPLHGVVGHSLGCGAATFALRRGMVSIERAVFVAPGMDVNSYSKGFAEAIGLSDAALTRMGDHFAARIGVHISRVTPETLAQGRREPLLIIHDERDSQVSPGDSERLAAQWTGARILTTHGLGHNRILRDPDVIRAAVAALSAVPVAALAE